MKITVNSSIEEIIMAALSNENLAIDEKGLLGCILAKIKKQPSFQLTMPNLQTLTGGWGADRCNRALASLQREGYLIRKQTRTADGKWHWSCLISMPGAPAAPAVRKNEHVPIKNEENEILRYIDMRIKQGGEAIRNQAAFRAKLISDYKDGLPEDERLALANYEASQLRTISPCQSDADQLRQRLGAPAAPAVVAQELKNIMDRICPAALSDQAAHP